jgi:hypothetical protein
MPNVERAVHLGIIRTTCVLDNIKENVDENMKKARRSAYALFGCGFHGENGLDPETMIHLFIPKQGKGPDVDVCLNW